MAEQERKGPPPIMSTAYHVTFGPQLMYAVDAQSAAARFPKEWSLEPWPTAKAEEPAASTPPAPVVDTKPVIDQGGGSDQPDDTSSSTGPVEIPADWQSLPFPKRRALALKLGGANNVNSEAANALIAAEVAKRAAAPK